MNHWIFVAAPHKVGAESHSGKQIYDRRMQDEFWGLGARTPSRKQIRRGDQVVFYIARPKMAFAGTARLASDCFKPNASEKSQFSHGTIFFAADYGVRLEAIET